MNLWIFVLLMAVGIGCGKAEDKSDPVDADDQARTLFTAASDRLMPMLDRGFVVSRDSDGEARHTGDALIWSGMAVGALDCAHASPVSEALRGMLEQLNGGLYRHPDLPNDISLDGALGLYKGVSALVTRCPDELEPWKKAMALHKDFADLFGQLMNEHSDAELVDEFHYVRDLLFHKLGLRAKPSSDRLRILEAQIAGWAYGVKLKKAACFRVHLGLISLQAVEQMGESVSKAGRDKFCQATEGLELPTTDHWCGRGDLVSWVQSFQFDQWEYRHQRCTGWETPDGKGYRTPGVDLLEAMRQAYQL